MAPGAAAVATEQAADQWRVNVPAGEHDGRRGACCAPPAWLFSWMAAPSDRVAGFAKMVWKVGADDPRRAIHALKVAVALTLCSVFYYVRPLYVFTGQTAMWAVLTVVVVFEYTVGGCLYKGLNRALALGVHWIASQSNKEVEPFILSGSLFLMAAVGTYSRFIPTMKARFDYGVTIFILTYSLVAVSGYRVHEVVAMAQQRLTTVAIGAAICFAVCAFVFPVWAGQELHALVARNMDKLAASVEGCVDDYFSSAAAGPLSERSHGYKFALNAKASEDSLANLARWEPAHGRFGFRHPYFQYQRVGAAMRCAAYCVDALAVCVGAETQAPAHAKKRLAGACAELGRRCAAVLREASGSVAAMAWSGRLAQAVAEMNAAAEELREELRCLATILEEEEESESESVVSPPLFTAASLLLEVCARAEGVVGAVEALATMARFKKADHDEEKTTLDIEAGTPVVSMSNPISAEAHLKVAVDQEKTTDQEPRDQVGQLVKMLMRRPSGKKWMRGEPKVCPKPPKDMTIQVTSPRNRSMEFAGVAPSPRSRAAELAGHVAAVASPRNRALELASHAAVAASSPRHRSVEFASHAAVASSPRHRSMDFAIHGPVVPSPRINRSMELIGAHVPSPRNRSILGMA